MDLVDSIYFCDAHNIFLSLLLATCNIFALKLVIDTSKVLVVGFVRLKGKYLSLCFLWAELIPMG